MAKIHNVMKAAMPMKTSSYTKTKENGLLSITPVLAISYHPIP
jgi:hypothetical protein